MKKVLFYIYMLFSTISLGQVANYYQFPSMRSSHMLDEILDDMSFAFSMRLVESDYNGPLIKLRRASDNTLKDFGTADNDIINIAAIDTWRGSNVYIHTCYDQSGLDRNADQVTSTSQPRFYTDPLKPHFKGDGSNDHPTVDTSNGIQDVTNNGNQGTVITVLMATKKFQHTFGVLIGGDRWSTYLNWSDNNVYFDPGFCCNNTRSFENFGNIYKWEHYTFIKTNTNVIGRSGGVERINGTHITRVCTRTEDFAFEWAAGTQFGAHSTASFIKFIMYKTNISYYWEIEDNAEIFWNL